MKKVEDALKALISAIEQQECYIEYKNSLKTLKEDKELFTKLNEFRKKNMEYHMDHKTLQDQSALRKEYNSFLQKEQVKQFLYWEQETTKLYRMIYDSIAQDSELDYSFLD